MYLEDLKKALKRFGNKLVQVYGQGESPVTITGAFAGAPCRDRPPPVRGAPRLRRHGPVPRRGAGRRRRGPYPARGRAGRGAGAGRFGDRRLKDAEATARTLAGCIRRSRLHADDGFLTLGPVQGHDHFGRTNIYPREVEEVLLAHPPSRRRPWSAGPMPIVTRRWCAFVVRAPAPVDEAALDALCLENIARFKRPRDYRLVDALPKNNYGKVLKTALRERLS